MYKAAQGGGAEKSASSPITSYARWLSEIRGLLRPAGNFDEGIDSGSTIFDEGNYRPLAFAIFDEGINISAFRIYANGIRGAPRHDWHVESAR